MNGRRLNALRVGNFKAFADTQHISLKPITLVFGPNSSGKSSFIHSLAMAHEAMRTGTLDIYRTEIGGSSVDLGGFRQFVHRTDRTKRVEWGIDLDVSALDSALSDKFAGAKIASVDVAFGLEGESQVLLWGDEAVDPADTLQGIGDQSKQDEKAEAKVVLIAYELSVDGNSILRMSRRRGGSMAIDSLDTDHPVFRRVVDAIAASGSFKIDITDEDRSAVVAAINDLVPKFSGSIVNFLPELDPASVFQGADVPMARGILAPEAPLEETVRLFFPRQVATLLDEFHKVVRGEIGSLSYLGPLRSFPARHMAFAEHDDRNWYAGGGYAWDVVKRIASVREAVNNWLGATFMKTPYQLGVRSLVALDQLRNPLALELEEIVPNLEIVDTLKYGREVQIDDSDATAIQIINSLRQSNIDKVTELVLIDQRTKTVVSHRDVGIGISQVLPVLVQAFASRGQIVAMEQPEIHLHPALQAELADVFIESAIGERKNTFVLETHSEHLILRLLRRVREGKLKPEDLCVLYVEPLKGQGSRVTQLSIDEDGDFVDPWPHGFFEEAYREKLAGR